MSSPVSTRVLINRTSGERDVNQSQETAKCEIEPDVTTTVKRGEAGLA